MNRGAIAAQELMMAVCVCVVCIEEDDPLLQLWNGISSSMGGSEEWVHISSLSLEHFKKALGAVIRMYCFFYCESCDTVYAQLSLPARFHHLNWCNNAEKWCLTCREVTNGVFRVSFCIVFDRSCVRRCDIIWMCSRLVCWLHGISKEQSNNRLGSGRGQICVLRCSKFSHSKS